MFDMAYFLEVDFSVTSNKAVEIWNKGSRAGGLSFSDTFKLVFFEGAAKFSAIFLSTHGSY